MLCLKIAGWVANSVDPDETPHSVASHLGLYCLLMPVCPNTYGKYGNRRNDFMFNLNESYVAEVGFELLTPGYTSDYAMVPGYCLFTVSKVHFKN